jgi:transposase
MTTHKKTRRSYTEEYKRDAVALSEERGYSVAKAAKSLGINENLIRRWKQEFQKQENGETLSSDEREELNRLRKEVRELRLEKEILKKASAYFAKEMK